MKRVLLLLIIAVLVLVAATAARRKAGDTTVEGDNPFREEPEQDVTGTPPIDEEVSAPAAWGPAP